MTGQDVVERSLDNFFYIIQKLKILQGRLYHYFYQRSQPHEGGLM